MYATHICYEAVAVWGVGTIVKQHKIGNDFTTSD